jgi:hypothetical protein
MTTRDRTRDVIEVADVMPTRLRRRNKDPLVARLKEYHWHFPRNPAWIYHPDSRCGEYRSQVAYTESAGNDSKTREGWANIETWADTWGVEIT